MIVTRPREWERILHNLAGVRARSVFIMGCGQCASAASTGGETEIREAQAKLEAEGIEVTGWAVGEVTCHSAGIQLEARRNAGPIDDADAVLVLSCGAGVQTVADATVKPVFPGLESAFLGNVVRHGVFEERCQMCGECVLDVTAGICTVTTCPKGLLNGPCGGMWEGMCEVLTDRECTHVRIQRRLAEQGRVPAHAIVPPKDFSAKLKPGSVNLREGRERGRRRAPEATHGVGGR